MIAYLMRKSIIRGTIPDEEAHHQRHSYKPSEALNEALINEALVNEALINEARVAIRRNQRSALDAIELVTHAPHAPKAALT